MLTPDGLTELLDFLDNALILTDLEGNIELWNHSAMELIGWKTLDVLGMPVDRFLQFPFVGQENSTA